MRISAAATIYAILTAALICSYDYLWDDQRLLLVLIPHSLLGMLVWPASKPKL